VRKGIFTENAALRLTDSVFSLVNQIMHVGGIFLWCGKGFGCVNEKILLAKLHFCGIQGVNAD
jgi:hypothetical protein